jgi:hypothetical protein
MSAATASRCHSKLKELGPKAQALPGPNGCGAVAAAVEGMPFSPY